MLNAHNSTENLQVYTCGQKFYKTVFFHPTFQTSSHHFEENNKGNDDAEFSYNQRQGENSKISV